MVRRKRRNSALDFFDIRQVFWKCLWHVNLQGEAISNFAFRWMARHKCKAARESEVHFPGRPNRHQRVIAQEFPQSWDFLVRHGLYAHPGFGRGLDNGMGLRCRDDRNRSQAEFLLESPWIHG